MFLAFQLMVSSFIKTKRPAYFGLLGKSGLAHLICELGFEILPSMMFSWSVKDEGLVF